MTKTNSLVFFNSNLAQPHPFVLDSVEFEYGHHRTAWMAKKINGVQHFFAHHLPENTTPLILTHASEGAVEAVITNFYLTGSTHTRTGSRFAEVLDAFSYEYKPLETVATEDALFLLDENHDINTITTLKKKYPRSRIIVDASDSFAILPIDWKKLPIDGVIISPERGLGGIPGATIVALKNDIFTDAALLKRMNANQSYTFDLKKYYESSKKNDTPYSPDISAIVGLYGAISVIEQNGGLTKHIERLAQARTLIETIGKEIGTITSSTPSQTVVALNSNFTARDIFVELEANNVVLEAYDTEKNTLTIGHTGYISPDAISILSSSIARLTGRQINITPHKPILVAKREYAYPDSFVVKEKELQLLAEEKANEIADPQLQNMVIRSASQLFGDPSPNDMFSYTNRTVGFIGAGRTVKETIKNCKQMGIAKFIVYSPSLAKKLVTNPEDAELKFWKQENVQIATTARDIFMTAETVVLLPTYYDAFGALTLGKGQEYINEAMVSNFLLEEIKTKGKMDLLINASARPKIIDRGALKRHTDDGWLRYISDETPEINDPLSHSEDVRMTGHVGGSAISTKTKIAQNTREIIIQLLGTITNGITEESRYKINLINRHLKPEVGWRIDNAPTINSVKFLLTDKFDLSTIDFPGLETKLGVKIEVLDISEKSYDTKDFTETIAKFKPNFMMIRTKTIIKKEITEALISLPNFYSLIRPGVGVENIYEGMQELSKEGIKIINEPYGNSSAVGEMTTRFITRGTRKTILTPGPTPHNPNIFRAAKEYRPQTTQKFTKLFSRVSQTLQQSWIQLDHGALILSTPSTGLMEAGVQNLTTKDETGLVIAHGKFGNRFIDICKRNGRNTHIIDVPNSDWGHAYSPEQVATTITEVEEAGKTISFVCLQQNETSSGVSYTHEQLLNIANTVKKHNPDCIIILDCVSGLFAHNIDFSKIPVDFIVTGSQKGLGVSSGISYAVLSDQAVKKMLSLAKYDGTIENLLTDPNQDSIINQYNVNQKVFYFSLLRHLINLKLGILPKNCSIFHIISTDLSLEILSEFSAEELANKSIERQRMTLEFVEELGLKSQVKSGFNSQSITAFFLPNGIDATSFRKELEERYGFIISGAQNQELKPNLVRIGHIGFINKHDTLRLIRSFKILLDEKKTI